MLLVTGSNGQLGSELKLLINENAIFTDVDTLDITDSNAVQNFIREHRIDTIINCAAYTNVDKAEDEPDLAEKINVKGVENLVKTGCKIIHISTDYVFDGMNFKPYKETGEPNPISVYGKTKLAGEKVLMENADTCLILRTSWMYSHFAENFVKTIARLSSEKSELRVVVDQVGTPTYAKDLAAAIIDIIPRIKIGSKEIYHYSNEGVCSWYDFACEIVDFIDSDCKIVPVTSAEYKTNAKRPHYSVLDKSKIKNDFNLNIRYWKEGLRECINGI